MSATMIDPKHHSNTLGLFGETLVKNICAVAGCTASQPNKDFGIDLHVHHPEQAEVVGIQVKTKGDFEPNQGISKLRFKTDRLEFLNRLSCKTLIVLVVVRKPHPFWTCHNEDDLTIHASAYWKLTSDLLVPSNGQKTFTMKFSNDEVFTPQVMFDHVSTPAES